MTILINNYSTNNLKQQLRNRTLNDHKNDIFHNGGQQVVHQITLGLS